MKLVVVMLVATKLVGLKVATAKLLKKALVEVMLVPLAVPKVRLVELRVSANAFVVVRLVPLAVVNPRPPEKKLVLVALVSVVDPRLVMPEILRFVEVTFVPLRLKNDKLVEVKLVPLAVPNEKFCAKKFAVELALVKMAVEAPVAPIAVLLIVPPSIVKPFTTMVSVMELAGKVI